MLKFQPTERGFMRAEFKDQYGEDCSAQESSLATEECIWLGMEHGTHVDGECLARMHLTRDQAAALAYVLNEFAKHGDEFWGAMTTASPAAQKSSDR